MNIYTCSYCGSLINKSSTKCPHCGADLSNAIKDGQIIEQKKKEEKEKKEFELVRKQLVFGIIAGVLCVLVFVFFIIAVMGVCPVLFFILSFVSIIGVAIAFYYNYKYGYMQNRVNKPLTFLHNDDLSITCEKIEKFNFIVKPEIASKNKTKQTEENDNDLLKLAFYIEIYNNSNIKKTISVYDFDSYQLFGDGKKMLSCSVVPDSASYIEEDGKSFVPLYDSYNSKRNVLLPNSKHTGWLGFYVLKNVKHLELKLHGESIYLDNPFYKD